MLQAYPVSKYEGRIPYFELNLLPIVIAIQRVKFLEWIIRKTSCSEITKKRPNLSTSMNMAR